MASIHKKDIDGNDLTPDFECGQCEEKFVSAHLLRLHVSRKHTAPSAMAHQCTYEGCNYASVESATLARHVRFKHTGERPFTCGDCGFAAHTADAMARHARTHTGERPHVCDSEGCGAAYADKKRLRDHVIREHSGDNAAGSSRRKAVFECEECGQTKHSHFCKVGSFTQE